MDDGFYFNNKCSITNLPVRQHREWKNVVFSEDFSCEYKLLGDNTIVISGNGFSNQEDELKSIKYGSDIVDTYLNRESGYLMIQDWKDYVNSTGKARKAFIELVVNDNDLVGIIFCNGTVTQELSVKIGEKLGILNKEILICDTYHEAAKIALRYEQLGKLPKIKKKLRSRILNRLRYNRQDYHLPIKDLLEYLNSIDWTSGKPKSSEYRVQWNHPLLPIFDALTLIKSRLEITTKERNQYLQKLLKHQEELEDELERRTYEIIKGEEYFSRIIENTPVSSLLLDEDFNLTYINKKALQTFGYNVYESDENDRHPLLSYIERSCKFNLKEKLQEHDTFGPIEIDIYNKEGAKLITEVTFTNTQKGYLISIVDITRIYIESITDQLTGLYNRRYFQETLEKEFSRAKRYNNALSLIIFDVDFFKKINDQYGHPGGDAVLCNLSVLTKNYFRNSDSIFRIGGEEFAVILPETDRELSHKAAERFRIAVNDSEYLYENTLIKFSISLGITTLNSDIITVDDFIKKTDASLYKAKNSGRNKTVVTK